MGSKTKMRDQIEQMMLQQMQHFNDPDPALQRLMGLNNAIIDWHTTPNNTVKDIYKHPTLGSKLPVFQFAKQNQDAGRVGRGIAGIGEHERSGGGDYSKELGLEDDFRRSELASGILETGLNGELDNAEGNLANLTMADANRRTSSNSMMQYLHDDLNTRIAAGGWGGFLRGIMGGAGGIASGLGSMFGGMGASGGAAGGAAMGASGIASGLASFAGML